MPTAAELESQVRAALAAVRNPRTDSDVVAAGMVASLEVAPDGLVTIDFALTRDDPATLVRDVRRAVRAVRGVADVRLRVRDPGAPRPSSQGPGPRPASMANVPPPPTPMELPALGRVIAVSSGKGGVGKSTVSANLAAALAAQGARVGLLDADVYGPNIPRMMGVQAKPEVTGGKIQPLEGHGVKLMSLGFLVERDAPAIWRGPIVMKVIHQFLHDVDWGQLDYFFVDLPPGTGDAQLSLAQTVHIHGALIVTTPQEVAVGDSLRGGRMFERVGVRVLGVVENMSFYVCPHCGERSELFLAGGGQRLADELGVPLLGQIPLQARLPELADRGAPVVVAEPDSPAGRALRDAARLVAARVAEPAGAAPATPAR